MSTATGRRPRITWGQFLDAAPYFIEALWEEGDCLEPEWSPLVRAIAFYDVFRGEVENGGVTQYMHNKADSLPHFEEAPSIVRQHPLLTEVADLMAIAHAEERMLEDFKNAAGWRFTSVEEQFEAERSNTFVVVYYEDKHRSFSHAFDERAWRANDAASLRIHQALLTDPHTYFDFGPSSA